MSEQTAVFGGGCFWCLDAQFRLVPGILSVECGYAGGSVEAPDYEAVCSGTTGHAEVVKLTYDDSRVGYGELLELFLACHDPTTRDRQGHDVGSQYRSIIVCQRPEQRRLAEKTIGAWNAGGYWPAPIVTELLDGVSFYVAEEHHQNYFAKQPHQGYCVAVVGPKVEKFRRLISRRS